MPETSFEIWVGKGDIGVFTTLDVLLTQIITQLNVHAADILLYDSAAQKLVYAAGRGFQTRAFESSALRLEDAHVMQIVREHRPLVITNLGRARDTLAHAAELTYEGFMVYIGAPLLVKNQLQGVLEVFHRDHLKPTPEWHRTLDAVVAQAAFALYNVLAAERARQTALKLSQSLDMTIFAWAQALELREQEPVGHTWRVADLTLQFARALGMEESTLMHIYRGALLHDIGKMAIPDEILLKPDSLTELEWQTVRQHPLTAYDMLRPIEMLAPAVDIPYCHHEKWDGTGYPRRLVADQIPLPARIFAIVDTWDMLRTDRPYRKAWPDEKIKAHIRERSGKQFDPKLSDLFLKLLENGVKKGGIVFDPPRGGYVVHQFKA